MNLRRSRANRTTALYNLGKKHSNLGEINVVIWFITQQRAHISNKMTQSTALVSGANGFIAQTLIYQLLQKGYKVIGQVRSEEKGENLSKIVNDPNFSYVIVPVIEIKGAFDGVLKDHPEVQTFFHTASPVSFLVQDVEKDLLIPAIQGTKYVLESVKDYAPQLKHFIYTSSAIAQYTPGSKEKVNEETWSTITYEEAKVDGFKGYAGSKKFAEKEVWKFHDEQKPNFTVTTVLPSLVLGPQAYEASVADLRSTASFFEKAIKSKTTEELQAAFPFSFGVDVRDVARAHIYAAENPKADGKRLSLSSGTFNTDVILKILNDKYPGKTSLRPNDPIIPPPSDIADNKRTRELLGDLIEPAKSIEDAIDQHVKVAGF